MGLPASTLDDYESGKRQARYVDAELPTLPFENGTFHLGLCSDFLFLYSTQLGEALHRAAIHEMCRVAVEGRIFSLLALGERSPFVDECVHDLTASGYHVTIEKVSYEFQRGGDEMMRVRPRTLLQEMR